MDATVASAWVFTLAGVPMTQERVVVESTDVDEGCALVAMRYSTVCGSDLHTISGARVDPSAPLILGHEGVGIVERVGKSPPLAWIVEDGLPLTRRPLATGDAVTWGIATSCGECDACTSWDVPQKCASALKYGHAPWKSPSGSAGPASLSGTYATHVMLRRGSAVVVLPQSLRADMRLAAPLNCALATMVSALRASVTAVAARAATPARARVAVIQGAGMLGVYAVALLKHYSRLVDGAAPPVAWHVIATDISPTRLALATRFGADAVVNTAALDDAAACAAIDKAVAELQQISAGAETTLSQAAAVARDASLPHTPAAAPRVFPPADLVVEVCGVAAVLAQGLRLLRPGGEYVLVGLVHPASAFPAAVTAEALIRRCATVRGVHNYAPRDLVGAVQFMAATIAALPFADLVSNPCALSTMQPDALQLAHTGQYQRVCIDCQH